MQNLIFIVALAFMPLQEKIELQAVLPKEIKMPKPLAKEKNTKWYAKFF